MLSHVLEECPMSPSRTHVTGGEQPCLPTGYGSRSLSFSARKAGLVTATGGAVWVHSVYGVPEHLRVHLEPIYRF